MVLKRKRSDSEISTSSSVLSSPLSSNMMSVNNFQPNQILTPSLFSSRTRKRHRDNRPSESDVHQHTLSLLYSAQQLPQHQFQPPTPFRAQTPVKPFPSSNQSAQQSSLHSFWSIPSLLRQSSPSSNSTSSTNAVSTAPAINTFFQPTNCEDCDASLNPDNLDAMDIDVMMEIDTTGGGNHACRSCGKQVCHSCAVSNLGAERKCLNCAGKPKVWVGGIEWLDQD